MAALAQAADVHVHRGQDQIDYRGGMDDNRIQLQEVNEQQVRLQNEVLQQNDNVDMDIIEEYESFNNNEASNLEREIEDSFGEEEEVEPKPGPSKGSGILISSDEEENLEMAKKSVTKKSDVGGKAKKRKLYSEPKEVTNFEFSSDSDPEWTAEDVEMQEVKSNINARKTRGVKTRAQTALKAKENGKKKK